MSRFDAMARLAAVLTAAASAAWGASAREELVALRAKLAAKRLIGRSSGWQQLAAFAEAHRKEPALAAEVLYDVGSSQRRHDRSSSPAALATLLERYPNEQPWAALATLDLAGFRAARSATHAEAIALYGKYLALDEQPAWRRAQARAGLASVLAEAGRYEDALAEHRRVLAEFPDRRRRCATALAAAGSLLVRLKHPQEAYQTYEQLSADYPWASEGRADLLLSIAQAYRTAGDLAGARAAYERLLRDDRGTDSRRTYAYRGLAMLLLQQENADGAVAVYRRMAADPRLSATYRVQAYSQIFELMRKRNDFEAMIRLAYELIAAHPSRVLASGYKVYEELVDALITEGRVEEALGIAKAYYRLSRLGQSTSRSSYSSYSSGQQSILTVVRALKAREGGLRSANAFLTFVGYGPEGPDGKTGTDDDVPDPLAQYRLPPDPARDRLFAAAAQRLKPDPLQLGYLYICWDKPAEALRAFRRDYLEARSATDLQAAASRLARAMRALGCAEADVDAFFDFQNHGPNGPDHKPKTADDLKDPILERK